MSFIEAVTIFVDVGVVLHGVDHISLTLTPSAMLKLQLIMWISIVIHEGNTVTAAEDIANWRI
jgi:hypothetical protein